MMSSSVVYVASLDLNGLSTEPLNQRKRSNALADFMLETMSTSPSKTGDLCLGPQGSNFGAI
jgi:hypothetical protein